MHSTYSKIQFHNISPVSISQHFCMLHFGTKHAHPFYMLQNRTSLHVRFLTDVQWNVNCTYLFHISQYHISLFHIAHIHKVIHLIIQNDPFSYEMTRCGILHLFFLIPDATNKHIHSISMMNTKSLLIILANHKKMMETKRFHHLGDDVEVVSFLARLARTCGDALESGTRCGGGEGGRRRIYWNRWLPTRVAAGSGGGQGRRRPMRWVRRLQRVWWSNLARRRLPVKRGPDMVGAAEEPDLAGSPEGKPCPH